MRKKIRAYQNALSGWTAEYRDRGDYWRVAHDARHVPISCATAALAQSVARYRRRRLKSWTQVYPGSLPLSVSNLLTAEREARKAQYFANKPGEYGLFVA